MQTPDAMLFLRLTFARAGPDEVFEVGSVVFVTVDWTG